MIPSNAIYITPSNLHSVRHSFSRIHHDQASELIAGCITWPIDSGVVGGCCPVEGRITIWPDGRTSVAFRDESSWGVFIPEAPLIKMNCGLFVSVEGELVDSEGNLLPPPKAKENE